MTSFNNKLITLFNFTMSNKPTDSAQVSGSSGPPVKRLKQTCINFKRIGPAAVGVDDLGSRPKPKMSNSLKDHPNLSDLVSSD